MLPQEIAQTENMRDLSDDIARLLDQLETMHFPSPGGYVAPEDNPHRISDFARVEWDRVPVKLKAMNRGTQLNAIFDSASRVDQNNIWLDELRLPLKDVEETARILEQVPTTVGRWNLLMMRSALAFGDLVAPNAGIPDYVVERYMAHSGFKPMALARRQ